MIINLALLILGLIVLQSIIKHWGKRSLRLSNNSLQDDKFLAVSSTNALKGFATIIIVFAHVSQYEPTFSNIVIGGPLSNRIIMSWGAIGVAIFFILSGYGCFISVNKKDNYFKWAVDHLLKSFCHFVVAYLFVITICYIAFGNSLTWEGYLKEFLLLKIPNTSSWYFKVQLLFYIFLALSMKLSKKHSYIIVALFVFIYAFFTAYILKLPDYWWKTSMCFALGCVVARFREEFAFIVYKPIYNILSFICAIASYVVILKDHRFVFFVQLVAYACLSLSIILIWNCYIKSNKVLDKISEFSLDCYLIHIGIVESIYLVSLNVNIKTIIFLAVVIIPTFFSNVISNQIHKIVRNKSIR